MKKAHDAKSHSASRDDLRPEYRFDYAKAKPNRFASRVDAKRLVVALDADVAKVFTTSEAVNDVLRALISTMPKPARRKARP
jgi:hypothetical protein